MVEHISVEQEERYRQKLLAAGELLAFHRHISNCGNCRIRLLRSIEIQEQFEFIKADLRSARRTDHLSFEQISNYVDKNLSRADTEILESHTDICLQCAKELESLQSFKSEMESFADIEFLPKHKAADIPSKSYSALPQSLWRRFITLLKSPLYAIPLQLAAAMILAAFFVWIAAGSLRKRVDDMQNELAKLRSENQELRSENVKSKEIVEDLQDKIAQLQQSEGQNEVLVALNDTSTKVTLDGKGNLSGLDSIPPSYNDAVKKTLSDGRLEMPAMLGALIGKAGILRSDSAEGDSFALQTPVGAVVRTDKPVFRWTALKGASSYAVTVYDGDFNQALASGQISDTTWAATSRLKRGGIYAWKVTALKDGKEIISPLPPSPEAKFRVLDQSKAEELDRNKQALTSSHLTAGIVFSNYGLLDDAEAEFQQLLKANPNSAVAAKLLREVRSRRR